MKLTTQDILLGQRARNKEEAIAVAAQVLVQTGHIDAGYAASMLGREQQANTFLGHGIAIPHGMAQNRDLIHETGIAVVQFPEGVTWNAGETVYLAVAIAARSGEHLAILARLTDILDDDALAQQLARTTDAAEILRAFAGERESTAGASDEADLPADARGDVTLGLPHGLHARPATALVEVASRYVAEINVTYSSKRANAKSMGALLKLGIPQGGVLHLTATGPDAAAAVAALQQAVLGGLGEVEEFFPSEPLATWTPVSGGRFLQGVSASPGLAMGPLHLFHTSNFSVQDSPGEPVEQKQLLRSALQAAAEQLEGVYQSVAARGSRAEAVIFRAHQAFLEDPDLLAETEALIRSGHSAAWSWQTTIAERVAEMQKMSSERMAERAADLRDVGQRVLRVLCGVTEGETVLPDDPVILMAEDLTPSDTAKLDPRRILGIITALGGPTAHTAIIARSMGIPCVVGAGARLLQESAPLVILDGGAGRLYVEPALSDIASAELFQEEWARARQGERAERYAPALMLDGHRVEITANIGKVPEAAAAIEAGAEGVGLLRTEFLFLERETAPTEEEQYQAMAGMAQALGGLPLIVRTLDIGGDKVLPYLPLPREDNPFLGVRGIRLCLRQPELFRTQLRAIYRVALQAPVKIMFPMVATLEEFRAARGIAESVRAELGAPSVEIGIMVEVPSAALAAQEFAREVDFFSIGTNDLTQYTLAMDRLHAELAPQVDALHPAVLRLVDMTVRAATAQGKWVGVCGGVAGDPLGAVLLTGLGVTELSMSVPAISTVKAQLRRVSLVQAQDLARRALRCDSAAAVHALGLPR